MLRAALTQKVPYYRALEDVTFEVRRGESFALIGENGAGKSTVLKVLAGILTDYRGSVEVAGKVSAILEVATSFAPQLTGRENIRRHLALQGLKTKEIRRLEPGIIEFSELGKAIDYKVGQYSSGMVAKLAFSVVTASINEVLLLDELLVVGDEYFQGKSFRRIKEICSSGRTVIIASHNLAFVERLCSRAAWIEKGRVKMIGHAHDVCVAYYRKNRELVEKSYPRATGYIQRVEPSLSDGKLSVRSQIMRVKPVADLHYQIAIHDNRLGMLAALLNTAWDAVPIPAGEGPVDIVAEIPLPSGLTWMLIGTVLFRGAPNASDAIIDDAWGWDNGKEMELHRDEPQPECYLDMPLHWTCT